MFTYFPNKGLSFFSFSEWGGKEEEGEVDLGLAAAVGVETLRQ